jgi:hypothetical protein
MYILIEPSSVGEGRAGVILSPLIFGKYNEEVGFVRISR